MELKGSLPHSQTPITCSYSETDQSSPYLFLFWDRSIQFIPVPILRQINPVHACSYPETD